MPVEGHAAAERRTELSKGGAIHVAISRIFRPPGTPPELGYGASRDDLKQRDPKAYQKTPPAAAAARHGAAWQAAAERDPMRGRKCCLLKI